MTLSVVNSIKRRGREGKEEEERATRLLKNQSEGVE
jgi:hypothetical protein